MPTRDAAAIRLFLTLSDRAWMMDARAASYGML